MHTHMLLRRSAQAGLLLAMTLILSVGPTAAAPAAAPTTTDHYVSRDSEAFALWSYDVPGGCGHTNLLVLGLGSLALTAAPPGGSSAIVVTYQTTDQCHGSPFTGGGFAFIPAGTLNVSGPNPYLNASLGPVPVTVTSITGDTRNLVVNLNWASTTAPTRMHVSESIPEPTWRVLENYLATFADATATGSVMLGSTNLTPLPSDSGLVANDLYGQLTITH